jgi:hypothetical protein
MPDVAAVHGGHISRDNISTEDLMLYNDIDDVKGDWCVENEFENEILDHDY